MFKLKEKWKSFKESIIRENKIFDVLYLMKKYNNVKFEELIQINNSDCYIIKRCDFLYFAVKKPNWKNYVGIHRSFYDDLSQDTYCTIDFNNLKFDIKFKEDIPKEVINELYDELIKNSDSIQQELELIIKKEYYKE